MERNFITKIEINNVRHLNNIEIPLSEDKPRHLILTGKNGSGKTSVLEALRLYLLLFTEDEHMKFYLWNFLIDDPIKKQFTINQDVLNEWKKQFIWISSEPDQQISDKTGCMVEFKDADALQKAVSEGNFIISYYGAERKYNIQNEKGIEKVSFQNVYKLYESPGEYFVKYLKELVTQETLYWKRGELDKADERKQWMDNFTKILKDIYSNAHLELDFDVESMEFRIKEPGKIPFSFDELASGYAAVLDIVIDLMMRMEKKASGKYDMEGIVMIDEVDAHLHLSLQKNILPILTGLFPNVQFIVTTHSPFVLNSVSDAVVYDLSNNQLIDTAEGLSNLPYSGIVEGYFGASELSDKLKRKFERYKELSRQSSFSADDYEELGDLESYLDEIPDFLALNIAADYRQIKSELEQRGETEDTHGKM